MVIGISGKAKSGKDTVAKLLNAIVACKNLELYTETHKKNLILDQQLHYTNTYIPCAFADNLKKCVAAITGCWYYDLYNQDFKKSEISWLRSLSYDLGTPEAKRKNMTYRELLQVLGTKCREIDKDIWAKSLLNHLSKSQNYIITDVRYKNEAKAIKEQFPNSLLIRVERKDSGAGNHPSETELDDYKNFDVVIDNNGTIEELYDKVKSIVEEYSL